MGFHGVTALCVTAADTADMLAGVFCHPATIAHGMRDASRPVSSAGNGANAAFRKQEGNRDKSRTEKWHAPAVTKREMGD